MKNTKQSRRNGAGRRSTPTSQNVPDGSSSAEVDPPAAFAAVGLPLGLCLGSKSRYRESHPRHCFIPNANVFCRRRGKVWWGDLDLLSHVPQLEVAARRLGCRLYVLSEYDGCFERANLPFREVVQRAVWHTGGRVRPDDRLIRRSGLSVASLAAMVGVSRRRLRQPQLPFVALQIDRKLRLIEEFLGTFARVSGYQTWGAWMLAPNERLGGMTPLATVRAGGVLKLEELFPEVFSERPKRPDFADAMMRGFELSYWSKISLVWPPSRRGEKRGDQR